VSAPAQKFLTLPNDWKPRAHQVPFLEYMDTGGSEEKRACIVWHRRAGKDSAAINWTAGEAAQKRGTYLHMFPKATQARKLLWYGIDKKGRRMIDQAFPPQYRQGTNNSEMRIDWFGSYWYACGADNFNTLVGGNTRGIVFSEWSLTNPSSWKYLAPILRENGGWAIFPYTPRGPNHGKKMADMAKKNPKWFFEILTVDDTAVFTKKDIEEERAAGVSDELIDQEYYCSFDSPNEGSYYGKYLVDATRDDRIGQFPWDPDRPVHTFWDIGIRDENGIWFIQRHGSQYHAIDYEETTDAGLPELAKMVLNKPYVYGSHTAGHDIGHREYGSGETRTKRARALGIKFHMAPKLSLKEGIDVTKTQIALTCFDEKKCEDGLNALWHYHREYDETEQRWMQDPDHDWSEGGASSFRYFAVSDKKRLRDRKQPPAIEAADSSGGDWMSH